MATIKCGAKDPATCRYHGIEQRIATLQEDLETSLRYGNSARWLRVREELEEEEAKLEAAKKEKSEESNDAQKQEDALMQKIREASFKYKQTDYINNAVAIHPAGCGCTDCIIGHSFPSDDGYFNDELAADIMLRGRRLVNSTRESYTITITKSEYSRYYSMNVDSENVDPREIVKQFVLEGRN